ncbi:MAG: ABC transporter permease [Gammaproteobacteria bacterium]|jgi:lipopolysaccharide transport system permease protein
MISKLLRHWILTPFDNYRLFHNFVKQDFAGQFVGSVGGILWLFITPVVNIIIYSFVFRYVFGVRPPLEFGQTSFVVFMMVGYLPWFAFADAMGKAPGLLLEKAPLITKVMFPVNILPVVGSLIPYLTHSIGFGLLLVYLAFSGYLNSLWLLLPFIFFLQFLFTMGLVAILSAFCVFLRDLQQLVALIITSWFFLTPIVYPLSIIEDPSIQSIYNYNPMHSFVNLYRQIVLAGELPVLNLQIAVVVSLVTYLIGGWLFMRIKHAFGDVL